MIHPAAGAAPAPGILDPLVRPAPHERRAKRQQVRHSLRASVKDGVAWSFMNGAGERYVAPFVILAGSSLWQLAAITALPIVGGALVQRLATEITDTFGNRRRVYIGAGQLQVLLWIPFVIAVFLPLNVGYWLMLAGYILFVSAHHFSLPAWFSTMGDLVPAQRRGRYFGVRNFLSGIVMITSFLGAGAWLTLCEGNTALSLLGLGGRDFGFVALFILAGAARAISVRYLRQMVEPHYRPAREDRFSFRQFLGRLLQGQYGRFVLYRAAIYAAQLMITTYLSWYMLDELGFSPLLFAGIMTTQLVALHIGQPLWGRLCDRWGSRHVLALGGVTFMLVPLLLLASSNAWYFGAVMLYEGLMLSAVGIASSNYMLDIVTPSKRARCLAFANAFNAAGALVGAFGGAAIATLSPYLAPLPWSWGPLSIAHPFMLILLAAFVIAAVPSVILLPTIHEVRRGPRRPSRAPS